MEIIRDEAELQAILQREPGALIVFGEPTCGVDNAVTPRLEALVAARFPKLFMGYIDCQSAGDLCAQEGVYALPVVRVYFEGRRFAERVRLLGLDELAEEIARPYGLMFDE
ncbi:MAG: thioredoxin family protein [Myxococcales bacterium]|nr:thioredoxin family protein [Myxococcales bacterium]